MQLEEQVASLELCKKLKELNVKKDSLFYYVWHNKNDHYQLEYKDSIYDGANYSAFTVAELGECVTH